ncbi:hypothetical protein ISN44_As10g011170 [Arabidopsis suecica]|uniref:Uncharacterized protein n=1 Tax=Arabidopsis suecica TaxID=45249 RepID=A0A8T1ZW13_ARASU|nr:hypothetical protein ISN44_As10g011170 [Arabidopsis suecica]
MGVNILEMDMVDRLNTDQSVLHDKTKLVMKENFILEERRISLSEFHTADEVWTTGTMGGLSLLMQLS